MDREEKYRMVLEHYKQWLNKVDGYTRGTMDRNKYTQMLKHFSNYGLKRTNFVLSVRDYPDKTAYAKARCNVMKDWRHQCWEATQAT
jgi:hypothetical protein